MDYEKIYAAYCQALREGTPIYRVQEMFNITNRSTLYYIINKIEKGDENEVRLEATRRAKAMMWKHRYSPILAVAPLNLRRVAVKDMFVRAGFTIKEISELTAIKPRTVKLYIYNS